MSEISRSEEGKGGVVTALLSWYARTTLLRNGPGRGGKISGGLLHKTGGEHHARDRKIKILGVVK